MNKDILKILSGIRPEINFESNNNFIENGLLDSLDIIRLVSKLEEKFKISINGVDIIPENFNTLESIESLIKKNSGTF